MKNFIRLSLVLFMLCLFVTPNKSNASTQLPQDDKLVSFNYGYLPNFTVNTIDSEQPKIKLANSWGHYKKYKKKRTKRYSKRYKRSKRYISWKQRKAAKKRHHFRKRLVHKAYYKKISKAKMKVKRLKNAKKRAIKRINASYKRYGKRFCSNKRKPTRCMRSFR